MSVFSPEYDLTTLSESRLNTILETKRLGRGLIEVHQSLDSTNARAKFLSRAGAGEGALIVAETQTSGRGRLGRSWHSPPGKNLYFSLILKPVPVDDPPLLTLAAGLAVAEALDRMAGRTPELKWPNDLLFDGLKTAGILTELETGSDGSRWAILGVGLNVNLEVADLPSELAGRAGSLMIATGCSWDRHEVLAALLKEIEEVYFKLASDGRAETLTRYRRLCRTIGQRITITTGGQSLDGLASGVDEHGRLIVIRHSDGRRLSFAGGEVTLRPSPQR
ncbi:MAG: biotin--[acetyl-CoA-carboxylase] ligase [Thermodesulfobacteriota bacterium]